MGRSISVMMGLCAVGLWLGGCKDTVGPTAQATAHAGTYTLVTVDGHNLPYTPVPKDSGPQVQSGAFTLNADGSVIHATDFGQVDGKNLAHASNGTYSLDDSRLSFKWKGGGATNATLEGKTLTLNWEGAVFVYRK